MSVQYITLITQKIYLLDVCIIKVHPSSDLCLEEECGVMFSIVTNHADQIELCLPSLLLRHPVEQLKRKHIVNLLNVLYV